MVTDEQIDNLLALHGMRREPDPVSPRLWNVYKGDVFVSTWNFAGPLYVYMGWLEELRL